MNNQLTNVSKKVKSFWDTSEGTTGMIVGLGLLGLVGWGLYKMLPFIITLLENTLYAAGLGVVLLTLIYVLVIDNRLRTRLWIGYKLLMRALTYSIISYDPIGVLREVQHQAKKRIGVVETNVTLVLGQKKHIDAAILEIDNEILQAKKRAESYKRRNDEDSLKNEAARLGRLAESSNRLLKAQKQTDGFHQQLVRALKAINQIHENIDFEINIVEREYKATQASHIAWKSVREAFKGTSEFDELGNDAWQVLADKYNNSLGEIDSFMNDSEQYIKAVETGNDVYTEEGLKILENLNQYQIIDVTATTVSKETVPVKHSYTSIDW